MSTRARGGTARDVWGPCTAPACQHSEARGLRRTGSAKVPGLFELLPKAMCARGNLLCRTMPDPLVQGRALRKPRGWAVWPSQGIPYSQGAGADRQQCGNAPSAVREAIAAWCLQSPCARARRWQPAAQDGAAGTGKVGCSEVTRGASRGRAQEASAPAAPGAPPALGAAAAPLKRGSPEHCYYSYCRAEGNRQRDI